MKRRRRGTDLRLNVTKTRLAFRNMPTQEMITFRPKRPISHGEGPVL
jgi:hypothetical protein